MRQARVNTVLHTDSWASVEGSLLLLSVLVIAAVGTGTLFFVSLLALRQRQSMRYRIVALAVGALFFRTLVGFGTALGMVPMPVHHFTEHTIDFLIAALVLYALLREGPERLEGVSEEPS